jgi:SSS family solute:Na+ symporter
LWAIFLLGFFTTRVGESAALLGFGTGVFIAVLHFIASATGHIVYGSNMTANFYCAIYSFSTAILVAGLASWIKPNSERHNASTHSITWKDLRSVSHTPSIWIMAALLLGSCALLNYWWR